MEGMKRICLFWELFFLKLFRDKQVFDQMPMSAFELNEIEFIFIVNQMCMCVKAYLCNVNLSLIYIYK